MNSHRADHDRHAPNAKSPGTAVPGLTTSEKPTRCNGRAWKSVRPELALPLVEVRLEPLHDARVHLAHPTLAEVQRRPDLLHRHLLVVVEDDDEPLVPVQ